MWDVYRRTVEDLGVELVDWHNPDGRGASWQAGRPVGQMVHHTAPPNPYPLNKLSGESDGLIKSNVTPRADGKLYLLAEGACNYSSGMGLSAVLEDVKAGVAPQGRARDLGYTRADDDVNGNPWYVNYEVDHPGDGSPLPEGQWKALIAGLVAGCVAFGLTPNQTVGHAEHTARKVDPRFGDGDAHQVMNEIRRTVKEVLDMQYKGVKNVPDVDWARRVVDWALESGLILPENDNDWDRNLTDGRYWTLEYRRR